MKRALRLGAEQRHHRLAACLQRAVISATTQLHRPLRSVSCSSGLVDGHIEARIGQPAQPLRGRLVAFAAAALGLTEDVGDLAAEEADLQRIAVRLRQLKPVQRVEDGAEVGKAVAKAGVEGRLQVVDIGLGQHQQRGIEFAQALQHALALVAAVAVVVDVVQGEAGVDEGRRVGTGGADQRPLRVIE
jgi:hypothetical protein